MPSGICKVKDGPNEAAADAFINAYLSPEIQTILVEKSFVTADQPERDHPTWVRAAGRPVRPGLGLRQQEPRRLDRALEPGHGLNPG